MITINTQLSGNDAAVKLQFQPEQTPELAARGCGICIGFFDGIHHGHQELLRRLIYSCAKKNLLSAVFSFNDVPKLSRFPKEKCSAQKFEVVSSLPKGNLLQLPQQRQQILEEMGINYLFCQHFDARLAALTGPEFLQKILLDALHVKLIVVGYDFRYGQNLLWGVPELQAWGEEHGVEIQVVDPVLMYGEAIHSARIRSCVMQADLASAQAFLGRPFAITAKVGSGNQIGRTLSFPTANQVWPEKQIQLPFGVYATQTKVGNRLYRSMTSFGLRPTIAEQSKRPLLETHLFDFEGDLYNREVEVQFLKLLRAEQKFADLQAMMEQLAQDAKASESCFWENERLQKWDVVNGRPIYILPSKRFRTGQVVVRLTLPQDEKNAARALALNYITSVSANYPTRQSLRNALAEMYGADLDAQTLQFGDLHDLVLQASALTRTPDEEQPFQQVQAFLGDILLHPLCDQAGNWDEKILQAERQNLCDELDAMVNNKAQFAWEQLKRELFPDDILSEPPMGSKQVLEKLRLKDVKAVWAELWQKADVRIYLAGKIREEWLELWRNFLLRLNPPSEQSFYALPGIHPRPQVLERQVSKIECCELEQSRLNMVWRTGIPYNSLQTLTLQAFNTVMGGESSSLLFNAVREERGLAYSIFSHSLATWEAWAVTAGIHLEREQEAVAAIEEEIKAFQEGGCREDAYQKMLAIVFTHLQTAPDRLSQLLNHAIREEMSGLHLSPADRQAMLREIDLSTVVSLSKKLQLQAVYQLQNLSEGESEDA